MKFVIINPRQITVTPVDAADLDAAKTLAGIGRGQVSGVDFGTVAHPTDDEPGVGVVVYEYSLFVPPSEQRYFAFGAHLFAGPAVLFGFDKQGETVDLIEYPPPFFFGSVDAIERAIASGQIIRPTMGINDEIYWSWPEEHEIPQ